MSNTKLALNLSSLQQPESEGPIFDVIGRRLEFAAAALRIAKAAADNYGTLPVISARIAEIEKQVNDLDALIQKVIAVELAKDRAS